MNAAIRARDEEPREARSLLLERFGKLREGHFLDQEKRLRRHANGEECARCTTRLAERFGCRRCTQGAIAPQLPHDGPRVCRRHGLWIGPGVRPEEQLVVAADVRAADAAYARLRAAGVLDAHRLAELLDCVASWTPMDGQKTAPSTVFMLAIRLAQAILVPSLLPAFQSRALPVAQRYENLTSAVKRTVGESSTTVALVDGLWMLLRVMRHNTSQPHAFISEASEEDVDDTAELSVLRSSAYPRGRHHNLLQLTWTARAATRYDVARLRNVPLSLYTCSRGHHFPSEGRTVPEAKDSGGCGFCAGKRLKPGFNTLADTHPELSPEWGPDNGELTPEGVMAGSGTPVNWVCADGHVYPASPNTRTSGHGCGFCTNTRVAPTINALSVLRPDLAAEWHPAKNVSDTPETVSPYTDRKVWWLCPDGHDYDMSPSYRAKEGGSCTVCSHRTVHSTTCLAATHPDVARLWHPTLNGNLTPEMVMAGTSGAFWWLCPAGHVRVTTISARVNSSACAECSGRAVGPTTSLAAVRPELAAEFHPTKNGSTTASDIHSRAAREYWWQCAEGHEWPASPEQRSRAKDPTCPVCTGRLLVPGVNDLATTHPPLARQWHPTRNGGFPSELTRRSATRAWWLCQCGREWPAKVNARVDSRSGCPGRTCGGGRVMRATYRLS
ncbi:zinc-ribbon domain-containing protein [Microbacterium sp. 1P06AB]|uniref:zinc-ribbon domain-containing protein n=1 Tax=Microbacterium sp. 1P06AB TaxID=3132289 RepID=UPI0039A75DA1